MSAVWRSASRSRSTQPAPKPGAMAMIVDCSCVEEDVRAASSRNRPDASLVRLADRWRCHPLGPIGTQWLFGNRIDHRRRVGHGLAMRVEHAADDEHPVGGRMRVDVGDW